MWFKNQNRLRNPCFGFKYFNWICEDGAGIRFHVIYCCFYVISKELMEKAYKLEILETDSVG